ncbi:hypothetical protein DMA11_17605 [Marinilabiliaceae bacterium JC017]|nr:hypothetical protein DMA11_17605 [Marinilabiliaceae bacterium JC017]
MLSFIASIIVELLLGVCFFILGFNTQKIDLGYHIVKRTRFWVNATLFVGTLCGLHALIAKEFNNFHIFLAVGISLFGLRFFQDNISIKRASYRSLVNFFFFLLIFLSSIVELKNPTTIFFLLFQFVAVHVAIWLINRFFYNRFSIVVFVLFLYLLIDASIVQRYFNTFCPWGGFILGYFVCNTNFSFPYRKRIEALINNRVIILSGFIITLLLVFFSGLVDLSQYDYVVFLISMVCAVSVNLVCLRNYIPFTLNLIFLISLLYSNVGVNIIVGFGVANLMSILFFSTLYGKDKVYIQKRTPEKKSEALNKNINDGNFPDFSYAGSDDPRIIGDLPQFNAVDYGIIPNCKNDQTEEINRFIEDIGKKGGYYYSQKENTI